ncbi:MAG: hypothetical protein WCF22_12405 [Candidatus Sulfotelmatobacter sp.]
MEVLADLLAMPEFTDGEYSGVSGHLGHISEFAAIQRARRELEGQFDAVVSLGGESFLAYMLADGRITNVLSPFKPKILRVRRARTLCSGSQTFAFSFRTIERGNQ